MSSAQDLITVAAGEVGYSRWNDPEPGTKYGRWYEANMDRCPTNYDYGASGVPYCAMFVSWCFWMAGIVCAGFPSAYCPSIHNHQTLKARSLRAGDVVLFDWELDGTDDHVGIVTGNNGSSITTIEGNTNNGQVARRTRAYGTICGGIRPDYETKPASTPAEVLQVELLRVDGWWGPATTMRSQIVLGTTPDGYISGQDADDLRKINRGGLQTNTWMTGTGGSDLIVAIQDLVGADKDRMYGVLSCTAQQRFLGTTADGFVSGPSDMVRAWQTWLNKQAA